MLCDGFNNSLIKMIVIAYQESDECYKFANSSENVNGVLFTKGDNVYFENECSELDEYINHSQITWDNETIRLFENNIKGEVVKEFGLTLEMCEKFGLKHYS